MHRDLIGTLPHFLKAYELVICQPHSIVQGREPSHMDLLLPPFPDECKLRFGPVSRKQMALFRDYAAFCPNPVCFRFIRHYSFCLRQLQEGKLWDGPPPPLEDEDVVIQSTLRCLYFIGFVGVLPRRKGCRMRHVDSAALFACVEPGDRFRFVSDLVFNMHLVVTSVGIIADFMAAMHGLGDDAEVRLACRSRAQSPSLTLPPPLTQPPNSAHALASFYARSIVLDSFMALDTLLYVIWSIKPSFDFGPDLTPAACSGHVHWFCNMYARCIRSILPVMDAIGKADLTHVCGEERPDAPLNIDSVIHLMESVYRG